jgi:hypothetical protein
MARNVGVARLEWATENTCSARAPHALHMGRCTQCQSPYASCALQFTFDANFLKCQLGCEALCPGL